MGDEPVHFEGIPTFLTETFTWLMQVNELALGRELARAIYRLLPPDAPTSTDFLAYGLFKSKAYKEAAVMSLKTLAKMPHSAEAKFNTARCLHFAGDCAGAEALAREVIRAKPDWPDGYIELAVYVCAQGRADEARMILENVAKKIAPYDKNHDVVQFNLGWHEIRQNRFKEGMRSLRIGRRLKIWGTFRQPYHQPMLAPNSDLVGRRVLLCGEAGAGDEMINVRFATEIERRGGEAWWTTEKPLQSLLARAPGVSRVLSPAEARQASFDYWAPSMDLVVLLGVDLKDVARDTYLSPDPSYVAKWSKIIPNRGKLRVGLRWQGNALYEQDLARSVPFKLLEQLTDIPGCEFYSLQRDDGIEELPPDSPVVNLADKLTTWEDTAGAVANLDLVISSCTSVPHLAAAMGRPVWLLCPINCYYIWATPGDRSPWYPSIQLFRQQRHSSWAETFQDVKGALINLAARHQGVPRYPGAGVREASF